MKTIRQALMFAVLLLALLACKALIPDPTQTPAPLPTEPPASTSTPEPTLAVAETLPAETLAPPTEDSSESNLPIPSGKPVADWKGIPVMPSATAGGGDNQSYAFLVNASVDQVQNYYQEEMGKLGWSLLTSGQGSTQAMIVMFMKGSETVSIMIIPQSGGPTYVMLVK